jgi:dTDP-4-dehydrorhamnose reductase
MLRLGKERDSLNVIYDQVGSPTYATDLAQAVLTLLRHSDGLPRHSGEGRNLTNPEMPDQVRHDAEVKIYHYSNEGVCSWYDFAKAIFELSGVICQVNPIETKDYPTPAKRPHYSLMNKAHIKQDQPYPKGTQGMVIPYWRDSLQVCLKELEVQ